MNNLHVKTNGGTKAKDKPRVYFSCHPADFDVLFQKISTYLLSASDCAVYFYPNEPVIDELFFSDLKRVQLIVIPVTSRLLSTKNRTMDMELPFALKNNIPLLPLMMEQGMDQVFEKKFGSLHYLTPDNSDRTAIPFSEKLKRFLEMVFVTEEMTAQIRAEFDATIFLSYRKIDRKLAQDLMHQIHEIPKCRDVSFWYDEFLIAGEDYHIGIENAVENTQLFALVMTPNMLIPGNYVLETEYPLAADRKARDMVKIVGIEMFPVEHCALHNSKFGAVPMLYPKDSVCFSNQIITALNPNRLRKKTGHYHDFLIGVAYLFGIDMEVNQSRGFELIEHAANAGYHEAMDKLADLYEIGIGTSVNIRKAIFWREKLVAASRTSYDSCQSEVNAEYYVRNHLKLFSSYSTSLDYQKMQQQSKEIRPFLKYWMKHSENEIFAAALLSNYQVMAQTSNVIRPMFSHYWLSKALRLKDKMRNAFGLNRMNRQADFYLLKADQYLSGVSAYNNTVLKYFVPDAWKNIRLLQAQYHQYKAYAAYTELDEDHSEYAGQKLSQIFDSIGDVWTDIGWMKLAKKWHIRALRIRENYKDDPNPTVQQQLAESYLNLGSDICEYLTKIRYSFFRYLFLGYKEDEHVADANNWLQKALQMRLQQTEGKDSPTLKMDLLLVYYYLAVANMDAEWMEKCHQLMLELADDASDIKRFRIFEKKIKNELEKLRKR